MWYKSSRYFCQIENFAYGEINERSFSNPHPRARRFPLPGGPGQVKLPVRQVNLNRFFLFISYKQIEEFQNSWSQASDDFE